MAQAHLGGEVKNVSVLVAVGVNEEGYREILGVAEGAKQDKASWENFLRCLKDRGLKGVRLVVSDKCLGLVEALGAFYPEAAWQRCIVDFYRNVWTAVPTSKVKEVTAMLKAIHASEDAQAAREKAQSVNEKLRSMKLAKAAQMVEEHIGETLCYMAFPREHWRSLRTNNPMERLIKEVRRRTRVVGAFADGKSALMLVAARLRYVTGTKWGQRPHLDMSRLSLRPKANPAPMNKPANSPDLQPGSYSHPASSDELDGFHSPSRALHNSPLHNPVPTR